jgi:hypothetical protein
MSQQYVELVRRIYEDRLFDRDPERVVHEFATPGIEYVNPPEAIEPGVRRGQAEVVDALRKSSEVFDSKRHELDELFDCGNAVVAAVRFCTESQGVQLVQQEAHTWTWSDGRLVRFEWGRDLQAALAAARVPP